MPPSRAARTQLERNPKARYVEATAVLEPRQSLWMSDAPASAASAKGAPRAVLVGVEAVDELAEAAVVQTVEFEGDPGEFPVVCLFRIDRA